MSISSSQSRLGSGTGAIPSYHTRWIAAPHSGSVKGIAAILVVAFLFRVGMFALLVHHPERAYRRDSGGYERPALNLLAGNGFSQEVAPPFTPDVRHTPLFPLFIAAIYGLIGPNAMAVVGAQVLVGTLTVALTCAMGWRLLPVGEAKAGGLLNAVVHLRQDLNSLLPNTTELLELAGLTEGGKGTLSVLNRYGPVAAVRHYFAGREWALPVLIFTAALLLLTYVGGLAGVVTLARRGEWLTLLLLLWPVVYFLAVPGAPSHPRFRVPVMPYICLLAGVGLVYLWSGIRGRLAAVHCG